MIASAMLTNSTILTLDMSGNPIGDPGGTALMRTLNYHDCKREILIHACTFPETERSAVRDTQYPTGTYSLDMTKLSDRVFAIELLRKATLKRGCQFAKLEHTIIDRNGTKKYNVKLARSSNPAELMGHVYGPWRLPDPRPRHSYTGLTAGEWQKILTSLALVDTGTGKPWKVPQIGTLNVDFKYYPRCATPVELLNATGLQRLIDMLLEHRESLNDLLRVCSQLVRKSDERTYAHMHTYTRTL